MAQAEIDTNTRSQMGQRRPPEATASLPKRVEQLPHPSHLRLAAASHAQVEFSGEAHMEGRTAFAQWDLLEDLCACERYSTICKVHLNVLLCSDSLYFCPDCR